MFLAARKTPTDGTDPIHLTDSYDRHDRIQGAPLVANAVVVAISLSQGGIPKRPVQNVQIAPGGIVGDLHAHSKHNRPDRAISLFDWEIMRQLVAEGFPLVPGAAGENITVKDLMVQDLDAGTVLEIGDVVLRLEQPRKPCYVLDAIDPRLKDAIVGRCGYMASVVRGGNIRSGMTIRWRHARHDDPLSSLTR